jgi:hypothetical protein
VATVQEPFASRGRDSGGIYVVRSRVQTTVRTSAGSTSFGDSVTLMTTLTAST